MIIAWVVEISFEGNFSYLVAFVVGILGKMCGNFENKERNSLYLFLQLSICIYIYIYITCTGYLPSHLYNKRSINWSIYVYIYRSVYLFIFIYTAMYLSVYLFNTLSIFLTIDIFNYLPDFLFTYLSIFIFLSLSFNLSVEFFLPLVWLPSSNLSLSLSLYSLRIFSFLLSTLLIPIFIFTYSNPAEEFFIFHSSILNLHQYYKPISCHYFLIPITTVPPPCTVWSAVHWYPSGNRSGNTQQIETNLHAVSQIHRKMQCRAIGEDRERRRLREWERHRLK